MMEHNREKKPTRLFFLDNSNSKGKKKSAFVNSKRGYTLLLIVDFLINN